MRRLLTVADLSLCRQRSDLASIQQSHDFHTLDRGIQRLITSLSEGPKSFEELRTVTEQENEATREHISKAFQQQQKQHEAKENRKRLLESLWFDEIHSREEKIVVAHRKTFEWIFDVSDHTMGPWANFIKWLKTGQRTYWINGKAGSGKSTLMSFLCQDDRTLEALRCWSGIRGKNVLMPKFYFWSSGTQMQKSIEGLLRSLIWQILQLIPDLDITSIAFESRDMIPAWTERRLQTALSSILQQASGSHLFCLFIDGLDEYEGDQVGLIKSVQDLVHSNAVKVCLSSRPYQVFDQAFGLSARLRLQDLTHRDIQKFVVDRFQDMPQVHSIAVQQLDWLDDVTESILARADGVFLWVTLAVKDQIRGLENGDSLEQLEERLHSLPDEVEGIYARMLSQIEKVYRKEASIFLQMASQTECRSVLEFVLASHDQLEDMLGSSGPLPERELIAKSHLARKRIVTTCAGLLEVNDTHEVEGYEHPNSISEDEFLKSEDTFLQPDNTSLLGDVSSKSEDMFLKSENPALEQDNESSDGSFLSTPESIKCQGEATDDETFYLDRKVTVDFIHRTARDFMQNFAQGGTFLKASIPSNFHPSVSWVKVLLAKARLFGQASKYIYPMMENIRLAEDETGVAQTRLCDLMDDVMSGIDRTCGPWPTNTHWSIRWRDSSWSSMHNELLFPDYKVRSRSSSNDPFHSVNSCPDTPDDSIMTVLKKPDFLAFAVYHNLHRYVQQVVHDRQKPLGADTVSYLLYCAVRSLVEAWRWYGTHPADAQNLIIWFLRQCGNPNLGDSLMTTWSRFLKIMHSNLYVMHHDSYDFKHVDGNELRRAYMQTTMAFVEKGADLHLICTFSDGEIPPPRRYSMIVCISLFIELSPLAAIELCLGDLIEYSHLRDLCTSKGAPYYSMCTQFTWGSRGLRKSRKVSDSESTTILEIYKRNFVNGSSGGKFIDEMATCIDKLFRDRIENVSESESRSSDSSVENET